MDDALTFEILDNMIKQFPTTPDINTQFKNWVKGRQEIPDDAVYFVHESLFKNLMPDKDIFMSSLIDEGELIVISKSYLENIEEIADLSKA